MADHVREHEETLDENNPRDYIDTILIEIKKTTGEYPYIYVEKDIISKDKESANC